MNWVSIDVAKCDGCGICVLRCPRCFSEKEDEIAVQADEINCNLCGHCVSLCHTQAITHRKVDMSNFIEIGEPVTFQTEDLIQFIRQRRSHRHFKNKVIPQQDLEKLIDITRYSPTGSNAQTVEIIVIQNPERIKRLSDLTVDFFDLAGGDAEKELQALGAERKQADENLSQLQNTIKYRDRLILARKLGFDPIFYNAPAVIVFHSPVQTSTPKDDCVIASTTMGLLARTMGLETTYIGLFEIASKFYEPLVEELELPEGHQVFSVLIMGYPRLKFLRTVDRRPIKTRWE